MTVMRWSGLVLSILCGNSAVAYEAQKPTIDRSAEPKLRAMMKALGDRKSFDAEVLIESREAEGDFFYISRQFVFRKRGGNKFRIEFSDYWGDYRTYVIDEKTFLLDPLDVGSGVTLRDSKKWFWENAEELMPDGSYASVALLLFGGEAAFDLLVKPEGPVFALSDEGMLKRIQFESTKFGKIVLSFVEGKLGPEPRFVSYDSFPKKAEFAKQFPQWASPPLAGALDVETIQFVRSPRLSKSAFSTQPPLGLAINDFRKNRGPKPPLNLNRRR